MKNKNAIERVKPFDIIITKVDGNSYLYNPKKDITAYEAARLFELMMIAQYRQESECVDNFILKHNLERHFDALTGDQMNEEEEPWCVTCGKLSFNGEFGTKENPYCPTCKKFWEDEDEGVE